MFSNPEFLKMAQEASEANSRATAKAPRLAKDLKAGDRVYSRVVHKVFILGDNVEITWDNWKITHHSSNEEF